MMKLETHSYETDGGRCFGFVTFNENGASLPKGFVSSMNAYSFSENGSERAAWIEIGIQSPTGDASDHHNFTIPCVNFLQAETIVSMSLDVLRTVVDAANSLVVA
ncbi:MAG: hypothetical protein EBS70_05765 [Actinobacteria bacterium]|nr:hypothetical protein [Actinomycetota bacterium]